jgi:hypothetical protein
MRNGTGGEGRVRTVGATEAAGVVVAAGTEAETAGVATSGGETDAATDGLGTGLIVGEGRTRTVAEAAGVGVAAAVAAVAAVAGVGLAALLAGVALGLNLGRVLGDADGAALAAAAGVALGVAAVAAGVVALVAGVALGAAAAVVAGVADAVAVEVSSGFTNFFGGAFGGGVASALNFVRARSAAERSLISVQPLSTFASTTRSFTRRGLKTFRTSVRSGTETSSSPPLTLACSSVFRCRRNRYRSIGRGPRERSSS